MILYFPNIRLHYYVLLIVLILELLDVVFVASGFSSVPVFLPISLIIIIFSAINIYKLYDSYFIALIYLIPFCFVTEYRFDFTYFKSSPVELVILLIALLYLFNLRRKDNFIIFLIVISMMPFFLNMFFIEQGDSIYSFIGKTRRILLPFILLAIIYRFKNRIDTQFSWYVTSTIVFIYLIPAVVGLIQYTTGNLFIEMGEVEYDLHKEKNASKYFISTILGLPARLSQGLTGYANNFSFYLVFVMIHVGTFFYVSDSKRKKIFYILLISFYFGIMLTTYSRGAIIFSIFCFIIYCLIAGRKYFIRRLVVVFSFIAGSGALLILTFIPGNVVGSLFFRLNHIVEGFKGLSNFRTLLFGQSIIQYRTDHLGFVPHNNYLGFLYDNGLFLTLIYFGIIIYLMIKSYLNYIDRYQKFSKKEIFIYKGFLLSMVYLMFMESFNYYSFNGINRTALTTFCAGILFCVVSKNDRFEIG